MASRKPDNGGASTATAEKPARQRKSPKDRAESLTVKAINAMRALAEMGDKLNAAQRGEIGHALEHEHAEMVSSWDEEGSEPETFKLSD